MSYILRSTLRYSVKRFGIGCLKVSHNAGISRPSPCVYQLQNKTFYTDVPYLSAAKFEEHVNKLDVDARRYGRISAQKIIDIIKEMKLNRTASTTQYIKVIRCCGDLMFEEPPQKRTQLVQEIWNILEKLGVALDISHYNALLRVYLENEHQWVPTEILAELERKGLEPNKLTYQCIVSRYCQLGDIVGATHILQFMREKGMPIDAIVFNALIVGHSKQNDMRSAEDTLNVMIQAGQNPSSETYSLLACGYVAQGNMDKVKSILEECDKKYVSLSAKDYMNIVYHMSLKDIDIDEMLSKIPRNQHFNRESVSCINKLVSAGKIEDAYKIVKAMVRSTREDGTQSPTGGCLVSALVRNERPAEEIIKYCDKLVDESLYLLALNSAMYNSLRHNKESLAYQLFRAAKERNVPVRAHYFWPFIVARGRSNDINGVYNVLSSMSAEFNVPITLDTVRDYVIPFLIKKETDIPSLVIDLKSCGIPIATAVGAIVERLLKSGRIREAAEIASSYRAHYIMSYIRNPLVNSYIQTKDADSFTTLLKEIATSHQSRAAAPENDSKSDEEYTEVTEYREIIWKIVLHVINLLKSKNESNVKVEEILKFLLEKGVGLDSGTAIKIQTRLQNELTQEISILLEKLTADYSTAAEPATTSTDSSSKSSPRNTSEDSVIRVYESVKAKGEVSESFLKELFSKYGLEYDPEKLLELKEEMEKNNFILSTGMYAHIIDSYVEHEKLDDAWRVFQSRCEKEPDFALNPLKMLRLAFLAVKNEQYDKAYEILSKSAMVGENAQTPENAPCVTGNLSWRILNYFAEKGDVKKVEQYFNLIVNNGYSAANNTTLGPLIKVHLTNDDLEGALKAFENCCIKHRFAPFIEELAKRCIETENATSLQRLTNLCAEIVGEINNPLHYLMLSFLECGKLREAKKILETPGLCMRQEWLQNVCQKYQNSGSIEHLENLLAVLRNNASINRSDLYYNFLNTYVKSDEPQKAMSLWLQLQEEHEKPNDLPVPSSVPIIGEDENEKFRKLLNDDKVNEAVKFGDPEKLNGTNMSLLLEAFLKHGRYHEAKQTYYKLQSRGLLPLTRALKRLSTNAALKGDVELLKHIKNKYTTDEYQTSLNIDNKLCRGYMQSGLAGEYLNMLEEELDSINSPVKMKQFLKHYPETTLFSLLLQSPEFLPQVERISHKCLEKSSLNTEPIDVLWMYHLYSKNYDEAEKLWCNYLHKSPLVVRFRGLCDHAVQEGNVDLLLRLKGFIERKYNCGPKALGLLYGNIIKVLVYQNKVSDAVLISEEAISRIGVENIMKSALKTLRRACVVKNIPYNYKIFELIRYNQ